MLPQMKKYWWFPLWLALLVVPAAARGAEFSALMMIKDSGKLMPGKIFVQDGKMRQEFSDEEGQTFTIVRPDKKAVYVVLPQDRAYVEIPLKAKLPGQFVQIPPDAIAKRQVGTETVNGYLADKFEVTVRGSEGTEKQTYWTAQKLGLPIKMAVSGRDFSIEYKGIKEGKQPDRLFDPPPGFKKATQPPGLSMY